jgi:hypothetical protein
MVCEACGGTGECGPCDGYGNWESPDADEVIDCGACDGDGVCAECRGTGDSAELNEEPESGVGE